MASEPPAGADVRLSILVVNWNTRDLVLRCLDALPAALAGAAGSETVVVDNGSTDGSPEALAARSDIRLVRNDRNLGFAEAVNQAYRAAAGELVLLLNSDATAEPGAVATLVRFLDEHPRAAAAAPVYRYPDGRDQPFHYRLPTVATGLASCSALVRRTRWGGRELSSYRMLDDDFSRPRRVEQPSATCLLLRRSVLPTGWLLDEEYPIFFNDVELAHRIGAAGGELWVVPEAVVVHEHGASTRRLPSSALRQQYLGSLVRILGQTRDGPGLLGLQLFLAAQGLAGILLRREGRLSPRQLACVLSGDPGPLPGAPDGA